MAFWLYFAIPFLFSLQADRLSMSAYKSDWYRYDRGTNRMLQIFILYSNRPLKMHAFFISMSLDTFLAVSGIWQLFFHTFKL